jgi:hypothetical protein
MFYSTEQDATKTAMYVKCQNLIHSTLKKWTIHACIFKSFTLKFSTKQVEEKMFLLNFINLMWVIPMQRTHNQGWKSRWIFNMFKKNSLYAQTSLMYKFKTVLVSKLSCKSKCTSIYESIYMTHTRVGCFYSQCLLQHFSLNWISSPAVVISTRCTVSHQVSWRKGCCKGAYN